MRTAPALRDRRADRHLRRRGYAVVPGVARGDVEALREAFFATHGAERPVAERGGPGWQGDPATGQEFRNDLEESLELRAEVEERLAPYWDRYLRTLFVDHRPVVSTFLAKWPGPAGHLPLHQDPSIVDERTSRGLTLWIALDDASPELGNGPLYVIPGSHRVADEYRGTNALPSFIHYLDQLWPRAEAVPVAAGDAVVLDGRVIHGSPPNPGDRLRLAVCTQVAPAAVPLVHAVGCGPDEVAVFEVDDDWYRRTSPARLHADLPVVPDDAELRPRAPRPFDRRRLVR